MNNTLFKSLSIVLLCVCSLAYSSFYEGDPYMINKIDDNHYEVIFVEMSQMSDSQARDNAIYKAAELAKENGYQYFSIDSEQKVSVQQSGKQGFTPPSNIYEDYIRDQNFGSGEFNSESALPTPIYPGLKVSVSFHEKNPGNAIDVCTMIRCN